jgi:hypothetical protein
MPLVTRVVATTTGNDQDPVPLTWPGTTTVEVTEGAALAEVFAALAAVAPDADTVALVAADVPDLPAMLVGKLYSALAGRRQPAVAICPAAGGGAVGAATQLPVPQWLAPLEVGLDEGDVLERLRSVAPKGAVVVVPGWHRVRTVADLNVLDPALEGWDATRAYLMP